MKRKQVQNQHAGPSPSDPSRDVIRSKDSLEADGKDVAYLFLLSLLQRGSFCPSWGFLGLEGTLWLLTVEKGGASHRQGSPNKRLP